MGIELWHGLQKGPVLDSFNDIVMTWNTGHPNSQVSLKHSSDYAQLAKEALDIPQDKQPSLVLAPEYMTGRMLSAAQGEGRKVIPITEILEPSLLAKVALLVKKTFGDKDGNLFSFPFNPSCGALFMNRNFLIILGKDPSWAPKSIEEIEEISKELISRGLVEHGYSVAWPAAYLVEVPAAQQDLSIVTPDNGAQGFGEYQLAQNWLVNHFKRIKAEIKEGIFVYCGQKSESNNAFVTRKVAFLMQGSSHFAFLADEAKKSSIPFEVVATPLPTLTAGQTTSYAFPLGGASIWVMNNPQTTKMLDCVKGFLNYLASEPTQVRWHMATAYVPALETTKEALREYYPSHPLHKAVIAQTIEASLGRYSFGIKMPNWEPARKELFTLIETILDPKTKDEDIMGLLKAFDQKWSTTKA